MIANFLNRSLTTEIAPMVYIMMFVSVVIGFFFMTGLEVSPAESVLYSVGVFLDRSIWGTFLFVTASTALIGFLLKNEWLISLGGIAGFMAWTFACITLAIGGFWYVFLTVALFHLLFHGYVVLANSLGYLRRRPIN